MSKFAHFVYTFRMFKTSVHLTKSICRNKFKGALKTKIETGNNKIHWRNVDLYKICGYFKDCERIDEITCTKCVDIFDQ